MSFLFKTSFPSNGNNFFVRTLTFWEFKKVTKEWTGREGWNSGAHEYVPFYSICPNGHKGLFTNNNQLIASLSAVRYAKDFSFLGIFIVDPTYRQLGIGEILAKTVLTELKDCALLGVNGVKQQVGNYQRKYGFMPYHNNFRFSGRVKSQTFKNDFCKPEKELKIRGQENVDVNQLIDYDANVFLYHREDFLKKWIKMPESYLLVAVEKEKICGYGVVSQCLSGNKIAPLFAKNERIAKKLYESFAYKFNGKLMQMDIPETNLSAVKLATQCGLYKTFETTRMYKGAAHLVKEKNKEAHQVYALTSLEIG
ncbi:hypothetical protein BEV13_00975 [Rickettsiella grylli]|uniref:GNAT family N-acetyltransferase n=1 Tax=Rickettsiella grylli TaxID=59196 RepID=UPI0008FD6EE4|nr:GNAT family N-acetyltransferase [Rickettsiella grylli]OJA01033.1 hypothetical protein BEV13_00975 [Rickettsiella grylli]